MPHRHLHRRKQGFAGRGSSGSFNYARPWQVFLAAAVFVCCVVGTLQVGQEYQLLTAQENLEYHVNDLDGVDFERPQVTSDWGWFKKAVNAVKKVVTGVVKVVKAVINVTAMYLGFLKCPNQHYPIYPAANPWDLGVVQQANYEKPDRLGGPRFVQIAQRYVNRMKFKGRANMKVLQAKDINQWRLLLVQDQTTKYLWVCFRGTVTMSNWVDNFKAFFNVGTSSINRNVRLMAHTIKGWQRQYKVRPNSANNRLYGFIGHSAGGYYANKVAINYDVWRITLNAYDMQTRSRRHVNFRTKKDPVTPLGKKKLNEYACLNYCNKGHSNIDFINCWRGRYSRYGATKYLELWYATYHGFVRRGNPAPWVNMPNQMVDGSQVGPVPVGPGTVTTPVPFKSAGWTKVFQCWGDGRSYNQRWYMSWQTLVRRAHRNYYQYAFVNPRQITQWAMSTESSNQWQQNVANGKALSYVHNGANSKAWANNNVFASMEGGSENFYYTCNNNRNPNLPGNIYWACGNGENGFHVIPSSRICRWSWSGRGFKNYAVTLYIKRTGPWPQNAPRANTRGWQKVYECSTGFANSNWRQRWIVSPSTLISRARTNVYAVMFVDPLNRNRWAMMSNPRNFFANNLRYGRALSYNGRSGLSRGFINGQVRTSYATLKENFAYSCSNNNNPRFGNNIYWACGNGRSGFHVIPSSRICRWSWSSNAENRIDMYVKIIGRWNPPRPRPRRSSSSA